MPPTMSKKRKVLDGLKGKTGNPKKKFRKQRQYHSSSDEASDDDQADFQAVNLADSDSEVEVKPKATKDKKQKPTTKTAAAPAPPIKSAMKPTKQTAKEDSDESSAVEEDDEPDLDDIVHDDEDDEEEISGSEQEDEDDADQTSGRRTVSKRNDPTAFSTSMAKILSTKLPTSARADPVLSRSRTLEQSRTEHADEKLDLQARAKMRAEKREDMDRGRVRDVLGIKRGAAGPVAEEEKRLRKVAQRGVIKLFNAVRAAQVRGEEAARLERKKGTVGMGEREKTVNEVSKQGFLELISGKKGKPLNIEEA
ncbi:Rrp15p-domain-containing protein [Aspergillus campestris IBT 28561]|uniref:Rrp15p-domain-containing protein n=1 Tax=Aspergillus campestris (strain IBT 28561) TaxID=1392248 RepID=A0A2I1D226_ASPC2|nr:Rrp15p-domain-containing protein [Aspergillus campestris IBT 28561]PKY03931.1 Rrp15p-domain-containing protein [Aspergillus campestris IBT 28561]